MTKRKLSRDDVVRVSFEENSHAWAVTHPVTMLPLTWPIFTFASDPKPQIHGGRGEGSRYSGRYQETHFEKGFGSDRS